MDTRLFKHIFDQRPKMNPLIAEGVATRQMEAPEVRLDRVWRCAQKLFPPGLTYEDYHVCTPDEELAIKTRRRAGNVLELSQSDVYAVEFIFHFNGKLLVKHPIYLPFTRDAGSIFIRGSRFTITPVIADRCLSVSKGSIFFPPLRDKITFKQFPWTISVDGKQASAYVQTAKIHHFKQDAETKKTPGSVQGNHSLVHYLICRYGLYDTFKVHFDCDPIFGDDSTDWSSFDPKEWVMVRSAGLRPRALKGAHYEPSKLQVAIRREQWNDTIASVVAAFFYVVDLFPERLTLEDLHSERLWCILFGVIIFGASNGEGKVLEDFRNHLNSLDEYVDDITREDLHADQVPVDNIYELMAVIIERMPDMLSNQDVANLEGKRLITWKYVLHDIVRSIFTLAYQLNPKNRVLQEQDLRKAITRGIGTEMIMKINGSGHPEVTNIVSPSDSMVTKFTSTAIPQSRAGARSARSDHDRTFSDPASHLHSSILAAGSFLNQPKADPGGASKLNVFGTLRDGDVIEVPERFKLTLGNLQKKISR